MRSKPNLIACIFPALEWQMLIGNRDAPWCGDARDCVVKRRDQLSKFIAQSDPRDIQFSTPNEKFDAIALFKALPPDPPVPSHILEGIYSSRIPILEFEQLLANMRHIERAIEVKKNGRADTARKLLVGARSRYNEYQRLYDGQYQNYTHMTDEQVDLQQTRERCDRWARELLDVRIAANGALAVDPDLKKEYDVLNQDISVLIDKETNLSANARGRQ